MTAIEQIKANAAWVQENFSPESGLADFGYNAESIAYLDQFISRNIEGEPDEQLRAKYVSLLGAFLGETLVACYGGQWIETDGFPIIQVERGESIHAIQPFGKVEKRIINGETESLAFFFKDFIPAILAGNAPPEWKVAERPVDPKKPWWKVW